MGRLEVQKCSAVVQTSGRCWRNARLLGELDERGTSCNFETDRVPIHVCDGYGVTFAFVESEILSRLVFRS
jgi:hypothetical protein